MVVVVGGSVVVAKVLAVVGASGRCLGCWLKALAS